MRTSIDIDHDDASLRSEHRDLHRLPVTVDASERAVDLQGVLAEEADAELWHCDRPCDLIGEVTGQPMRWVGT